jgi:translation initiation factor 3 subunit C
VERLVPDDKDTLLKEIKTITFFDKSRSSYIEDRSGANIPSVIFNRFVYLINNSKEIDEEDEDSDDEGTGKRGRGEKQEYVPISTEQKVKQIIRWAAQTQLFKDAFKVLTQKHSEAANEEQNSKLAAKNQTEKIKSYKFKTVEEFLAQVAKVNAKRGRKGFSFENYCSSLKALVSAASNFGLKYQISAMLRLVSVCFDLGRDRNTAIPAKVWRSSVLLLLKILRILETNPNIQLKRITTDSLMDDDEEEEGGEGTPDTAQNANTHQVIRTHANFVSLAMQFQQDLTKALKLANNRSDEYLARVADETLLHELFIQVHKYFESEAKVTPRPSDNIDVSAEGALKAHEKALQAWQEIQENIAAVAKLQIEHIYYLHDSSASQLHAQRILQAQAGWDIVNNVHPGARGSSAGGQAALNHNNDDSIVNPAAMSSFDEFNVVANGGDSFDSIEEMKRLCKIVYNYNGSSSARMRVRAVLCQIYHLSSHDRYADAKMLLLMSRFQDKADDWDIETQVVFNRTMAQLGLAALRADKLTDALRCLADLCSGSKINELLAQRTSRYWNHDKNATKEEQALKELKERQRLLPFHRHINTDLLEACHNISAMLIEIPNLVAEGNHQNLPNSYEPSSRIFRRSLEKYELQVFEGPPENNRERVMLAAQHLSRGDWRTCAGLVFNLKCWSLWQHYDVEAIHKVLLKRMKEVALRTYLLKFHTHYASLGVDGLCRMFELPVEAVHIVLNRMVIAKEFVGSWKNVLDGTPLEKQAVHVYHVEPTPLQRLALTFADKATQFGRHNVNLLNGTTDGNFEVRKGDRRYNNRRNWGRNNNNRGGRNYRRGARDLVQAPGRMQIRWK